MTDPTMPRRPIPSLSADPGMLRVIRVEARRRRVRRLQTTGAGTSTLLLVAALALVDRGGSTVGLEPVVPPVVVASALPSGAPKAVVPGVVNVPAQPAGPAVTSIAPSSAAPTATPPRSATSARRQGPAQTAPPVERSVPGAPVSRSERDAGVQAPCTAGTAVPDWCLAATVDSGSSGERSTLQLTICPTDRTGEQTLTYARDVETRFVVTQAGREVWTSDNGRSTGPGHAVAVTAGRCVVWSVEWDQTDGAGELVTPGDYDLIATSYAAEVADAPTSSTSFTAGSPAT